METAPNCDFGPNGSTLHRHGYRSAELSSGHGCQLDGPADAIVTYSQTKYNNRILHLCTVILWVRQENKRKEWKIIYGKCKHHVHFNGQ